MLIDYLKERDGVEAVVFEGGFYTYLIQKPQFYVADFYIAEEWRGAPKFIQGMLQDIEERARKMDCTYVTCHVGISNKNLNAVVASRLKWGFRITGIEGDNLAMVKKLEAVGG